MGRLKVKLIWYNGESRTVTVDPADVWKLVERHKKANKGVSTALDTVVELSVYRADGDWICDIGIY